MDGITFMERKSFFASESILKRSFLILLSASSLVFNFACSGYQEPMNIDKRDELVKSVSALQSNSFHADFTKLDEALPGNVDISRIAPVFDFDTDGCLPAGGISRSGQQNGGLKPTGSITGECRSSNFMDLANTYHRHACALQDGVSYCGHLFALYFEKDQIIANIESGHRHDWEHAAVWTRNGVVTHASFSAHGELITQSADSVAFENGHVKIVYHKDGATTHAFRFGGEDELAENPYGHFVTPDIVSWFTAKGDNFNNQDFRSLMNGFDYGSANFPLTDFRFEGNLNEFRPDGYPEFTQENILAANHSNELVYMQIINRASNMCLDAYEANMAPGTRLVQWHCSGVDWQKWALNPLTGTIHNKLDPAYCLDNGGIYENGSLITLQLCNGSDSQQFVLNGNGIGMKANPGLVLDGGHDAEAGDQLFIWGYWLGAIQMWTWAM